MNSEQQSAILTIALLAAFADGAKDDREREQIRQIAQSLGGEAGAPDLTRLYQDVLLKRVDLATATSTLTDSGERQLAFEMAVCVCDADGRQSEAEQRFLAELKGLLHIDPVQAAAFEQQADSIVEIGEAAVPAAGPVTLSPDAPAGAPVSEATAAQIDKSILNYAIVNGALELLPQSWASIAIIPLQIKMVYRIGQSHGVELDQGHIKEFIATAGVGVTSQYIEQFGRKLIRGLLGMAMGKTMGKVGATATGVAFSFATTYALGQLAQRYYADGRQMNTAALRETFQNLLGPAKQLQTQYLPQIQQKAGTLDAGKIMAMVRGA